MTEGQPITIENEDEKELRELWSREANISPAASLLIEEIGEQVVEWPEFQQALASKYLHRSGLEDGVVFDKDGSRWVFDLKGYQYLFIGKRSLSLPQLKEEEEREAIRHRRKDGYFDTALIVKREWDSAEQKSKSEIAYRDESHFESHITRRGRVAQHVVSNNIQAIDGADKFGGEILGRDFSLLNEA